MFQRKSALQDMMIFLVVVIALAACAPSSHAEEIVRQRMQRAASSSTVDCASAKDAWYCGSHWPPSYCDYYYNVPPTCPFMCKLCQATSPPSSTFSSARNSASTTPLTTIKYQPTTTRATSTAAPSTKRTGATSTVKAATSTTTSKPVTTASMTTSSTSGCPSPSYPSTHTACLSMSPYAVNPRGVSATEKKLIVDLHNYLRSLQQATDMQRMVWDDEVAYVAQKWSDNCNFNHDSKRYIPDKYSAGQNIAYGYATWNSTIMAWYNEVSEFTYGSSSYDFEAIGHYTQIVWNSTAKIGCGATKCTNLRGAVFYVCNYAPAGNMSPQIPTPYTRGTRCAACPGRCNNGLCDCGGLVCKNGGTLNLNTCQCTCQSPYTGMPDCNLNCTGAADRWYCSQWPKDYCTRYSNVPYECPIKCSICKAV